MKDRTGKKIMCRCTIDSNGRRLTEKMVGIRVPDEITYYYERIDGHLAIYKQVCFPYSGGWKTPKLRFIAHDYREARKKMYYALREEAESYLAGYGQEKSKLIDLTRKARSRK